MAPNREAMMADPPAAPARGGSKDPWFMRKVGPFPVWVYGLIAVGGWYWYTHYGPGSKTTPATTTPAGQGGLKTFAPKITEVINYRGQPAPPARKPPQRTVRQTLGGIVAGSPNRPAPGPATGPNKPAPPAPHTGPNQPWPPGTPGPNQPWPVVGVGPNEPADRDRRDRDDRDDRDRRDRDDDRDRRDRDRDRRGLLSPPRQSASANYYAGGAQPGQAVSSDTGQPVYWEWTHAHRPPEVAYQVPVPEPQQAYAPMTNGATYDAASAAATLAG